MPTRTVEKVSVFDNMGVSHPGEPYSPTTPVAPADNLALSGIAKLEIRGNPAGVVSITATYRTGAAAVRLGGEGGDLLDTIELKPGEYIVGMFGTYEEGLLSIGFVTYTAVGTKLRGPYGNHRAGTGFSTDLTARIPICGFSGWWNSHGIVTFSYHMIVEKSDLFGSGGRGQGNVIEIRLNGPGEQIKRITVRDGGWVDGIDIHIGTGVRDDLLEPRDYTIGGQTGRQNPPVDLGIGERIIGVQGRTAQYLGQIEFYTSWGRKIGSFGGSDGTKFSVAGLVLGLYGQQSVTPNYVASIGFYTLVAP